MNSGRGAFPLAQVQHMNERYLDHYEKNRDKARQEYPIEESRGSRSRGRFLSIANENATSVSMVITTIFACQSNSDSSIQNTAPLILSIRMY